MPTKLPRIRWKGKIYTFDYRLKELRILTRRGLEFIRLYDQEAELLQYAVQKRDRKLMRSNMEDLEYKL